MVVQCHMSLSHHVSLPYYQFYSVFLFCLNSVSFFFKLRNFIYVQIETKFNFCKMLQKYIKFFLLNIFKNIKIIYIYILH